MRLLAILLLSTFTVAAASTIGEVQYTGLIFDLCSLSGDHRCFSSNRGIESRREGCEQGIP